MKARRSAVMVAFLGMLTPFAAAEQGPIDYRQSVYQAIGGHMSAMADIIRGKVERREDLALHARSLGQLAKLPRHLFPPESREGKTDAKPAIWEQPEAFQQRLRNFEDAAAELAANANADTDTFVESFSALGDACKACHDDFRAD